ncbi:MAG: NAD-dependent epimerase/dehydratase family protein [Actinobacteria bacterium]|nr:NAD-dependent epimerase/dehydratase family protein [Actinomycetota bacterium]
MLDDLLPQQDGRYLRLSLGQKCLAGENHHRLHHLPHGKTRESASRCSAGDCGDAGLEALVRHSPSLDHGERGFDRAVDDPRYRRTREVRDDHRSRLDHGGPYSRETRTSSTGVVPRDCRERHALSRRQCGEVLVGSVSRFHGSRVLVTGGLGFIGSNVAVALQSADAEVTVLDNLTAQHGGDRRNLAGTDGIRVVIGDIADHELVAELLRETDFVFNLAGQVSHHESMTDPIRDTQVNVVAQLEFLESVRRHRPEACIVHSSTRQVYGVPSYLPVDEAHPTHPRDINGANKLAGETYHRIYANVHSLKTVCLRLSNIFGPRQCLSKPGLGFMPVFMSRVQKGEPLRVFGDGSQTRDCLYVDDLVTAILESATRLDDGRLPSGEVINIGHEQVLSLREIADRICSIAMSGSHVEHVPWPPDLDRIDIGAFQGDYQKAKRLLHWTPRTSFDQAVARTLDFYGENPWYLSSI